MKTTIIILVLLLIIAGIYIFFPSSEPGNDTIKAYHERDNLQILYNQKQASYNITALQLKHKEAELLISRAAVKRSEDQLAKSKGREMKALKAKKEEVLKMTDIEADSAIKSLLLTDQDSIPQKMVYKLVQLNYCDSVRAQQDQVISLLDNHVSHMEEHQLALDSMNKLSRDQISILLSSQDKDKNIIAIKDKQLRKLRRQNIVLKVLAPVAFVVGVLIVL